MAAKDRAKRFPIRLPSWHEKRLIWWAAAKGLTKTGLAQSTLQSGIEANEPQINVMIAEMASDKGLTIKELKEQLLNEAGYSVSDENDDIDED